MKKAFFIIIVALAMLAPKFTAAQVQNPTNGHYYELVTGKLSWTQAEAAAEARVYNGMHGHLATIDSADVNSFIESQFSSSGLNSVWTGGYQDTSAPDYSEPNGGWRWIGGQPWGFTNWSPGEPNNYMGTPENYVILNILNPAGQWNDGVETFADIQGYLVEYEPNGLPADTTPPTITITSPANAAYLLNQAVTASYSCTDSESGVASCVGTVPNGNPIDTASAGTKTFTVTATDNAGNTSTKSVSYTVGYAIDALYDQAKAHKSGSTIPIKLQLVDANGANVSSASIVVNAISVVQVSTNAPGTLEDAGNSNPDSNFRYDDSLGGYIFNLKTTGYATGTYNLNFKAGSDPTLHTVQFQIK